MKHLSNIFLLLALLLAGCAAPGTPDGVADVDLPDVHGIAVSPDDPDVLFVATHQGLLRWEDGVGWSALGSARDDYMGFTAHPTDPATFWVSGHPRGGGNMGVRQTTDGGETWTTRWSEPVDFHAMTATPAEPVVLWGYYRGTLYRSADEGTTWRGLAESPPQIRALAADPTGTLYATTPSGLAVRHDGNWTTLAGLAALGIAVDPTAPGTLYAGGAGEMWKSVDAGASWEELDAPTRGAFAYLSVSRADPRVVYAATYETGLYKSEDAGGTWVEVRKATR